MFLIFLVNRHGCSFERQKGVTITNPFQKLLEIKVHNFTIDQ